MDVRRCSCCHEVKPVTEFYKNLSVHDGLTYDCKKCHDKRSIKYMAKRRAKIKAEKERAEKRKYELNKTAVGGWIIRILNHCKKGVNVFLVKQNMMLDQSPIGKLLTAIMAAFAEMERDLLSQRTKEALARKKKEGVHLGRPKGFTYSKLNKEDVIELANGGYTKAEIARMLDCSWVTVHRFMCENNIKIYKKES